MKEYAMKPDSVVSSSGKFSSLPSFFSSLPRSLSLHLRMQHSWLYSLLENLPAFLDGSYGTLRILGVSSITRTRRLSMQSSSSRMWVSFLRSSSLCFTSSCSTSSQVRLRYPAVASKGLLSWNGVQTVTLPESVKGKH